MRAQLDSKDAQLLLCPWPTPIFFLEGHSVGLIP